MAACDGHHSALGLCRLHYDRQREHGDPLGYAPHSRYAPAPERFWAKVDRRPNTACWEWNASRTGYGYGQFSVEGTATGAHRYSYELHNGPVPDGLHVLHRCDNPPCVNPDHLFLGDRTANMADMAAKGRARNLCDLTPDNVQAIREQHGGGARQVELAMRYGVSQSHVSAIVGNRAHVTDDTG